MKSISILALICMGALAWGCGGDDDDDDDASGGTPGTGGVSAGGAGGSAGDATGTGGQSTGPVDAAGTCQVLVDCQFAAGVPGCEDMYFNNCVGANWNEQGALDCINTDCMAPYNASSQGAGDCATFQTCLDDCVFTQNHCIGN